VTEQIDQLLQQKLSSRLRFYEDIGIRQFFRHRVGQLGLVPQLKEITAPSAFADAIQDVPATGRAAAPSIAAAPTTPTPAAPVIASVNADLPAIIGDTLEAVRRDIGENCTRCKLHAGRTKLVFGDGSPTAKLLFIGEGPGRDEDLQGLPFIGRAGKLLTQMIEAMGLQRAEVYICNVVKCRPPQNRAPEPDEVEACSPFLLRQIDLVNPQVIVCLGSIAAKTILNTTMGISSFRGQWREFRGRKLMATYHPAYLLRNPAAKSDVWKDLQKVMAELGLEVKQRTKSAAQA
jgi:uracil-DNA glycosylase